MPISFKKPSAEFVGPDSGFGPGSFSNFVLEMDVDDSLPLDSILEGCSLNEVTFKADTNYVKISNGELKALKNTKGAKGFPSLGDSSFDDYVVLYAVKAGEDPAGLFIRIYDKPTGIYLCNNVKEIFDKPERYDSFDKETQAIFNQNFGLFTQIKGSGLEVKPGGMFNLYYKVTPKTAQQAVRFFSVSTPMQENIKKMTFKDAPYGDNIWTTVTVSNDADFYAGDPGFKEPAKYGTFLIPKRGMKGSGKPIQEIQLQIVEYNAMEPKPLDYLATTLPVNFKNSVGGRIGTIDGGLRIFRDATGRSLVKDVYKNIPAELLKKHAKAVVLRMTDQGAPVMKPGISYTYSWDEARKTYCLYEPDYKKNEKSIYKDIHGYAIAVHTFGKKMTWSDQKEAVDYSLSDAWKEAGKFYGTKTDCKSTSGYRLTSHLHFYNASVSQKKGVNPVRCLKDYHYKWPGLLYTAKDSGGSDVVSYWLLPSISECKMMSMRGYHNLSQALAARINYAGGDLPNTSRFWTSSLVEKDFSKVQVADWDDYYGATTLYAPKDAEYDVRPLHCF